MKTQLIETLITLLEIPGIGRKKTRRLINQFSNRDEMTLVDLIDTGIDQKLITQPLSKSGLQSCIDRAKEIMEQNDRYGIKVISMLDENPFSDAPIFLYALGNVDCLKDRQRVAVIGSRRPGRIGARFAFSMGQGLAEKKAIVVSGLAIGCDAAAHQGCLSKNGQTIAFLPSGLRNIYPDQNQYLAEAILEKEGCLLSEYPLDTPPKSFHFIERDRLQAGFSDCLVVSTFSETGGTLHTLKYADRYSKIIFTIPEIINQTPDAFLKLTELGISYEIASFSELLKKIKR